MVNRRSVIRIDDNTFLSTLTQVRFVIAAAAIAICLAYLAGGARGVGAGMRDYVFSPAVDPQVQRDVGAADVPLGAPPTLSAVAARGSLAVALGRRSALRDFAAISAAVALAIFAAALYAAGLPPFASAIATIGLGLGDTFWWRGTTYTADALFPALALLAVWAGLRWRATSRRLMMFIAMVAAVAAIVDVAVPLAGRDFGTSPQNFVSSLTREFTPLGACLALVGLVVLLHAPASRLPAAIAAITAITWHALSRSAIEPIAVALVLGGWWAIAAALAWLQALSWQRSRPLVLAIVAVVLVAVPSLTRMRLSALGADLPSSQRVLKANEFPIADVTDAAIVAESRRADAAILLAARLAHRKVTIIPQSPESVAEAMRAGGPVFAFDGARTNLEQYGFLFERAYAGNVAVATATGRVPCVPLDQHWQDVSLLVATGSFTMHGAASEAPGGVIMRTAADAPIAIAAIEPRSIPYDFVEVAREADGVPELIRIGARGGAASIASLRIPASGRLSPVTLTFASAPAYAVAKADDDAAVSVCAGVQRSGVTLPVAAGSTTFVRMGDPAPFGPGWHPVEADPDLFRWTGAPDSSLRITSARASRVNVTITATPASRAAARPEIGLTVNGCHLAMQLMQAGQGDYAWTVEEGCWVPGVNQLWIHTSPLISPATLFSTHDTRLLGARIGAIRFTR